MTYRQIIHIDAPAAKVFSLFKDPNNWRGAAPEQIMFKDVTLTPEGVGTRYTWTAKIACFSIDGFDVFTEFVPNERIVDRSSSPLEGTWTYVFEPDGAGTKLTVENRVRSFWRIPPLEKLLDWFTAKTHGARLVELKAVLEE